MNRSLPGLGLFALLTLMPAAAAFAQGAGANRQWQETGGAPGERRIALVIGNTHYGNNHDLKNPVNDAKAMSDALKTLGFDVLLCLDQTNKQMAQDVKDFRAKLGQNAVGLFYYSGHGAQIDGVNYLIPVGFDGHDADDFKYEAFPADRVLDVLNEANSRVNIVILDACRDNPFTNGTRSMSRGLAQMIAPSGTLIAYATAPGKTAEDNPNGANGLFTQALLKHLREPGRKIEDIFKTTRADVMTASNNKQVPWDESSLVSDFFFAGGHLGTPPIPAEVVTVDTKARLKITGVPANAVITVDGERVTGGTAEIDLGLQKTKAVEVGIEAPKYRTWVKQVTLRRGQTIPLNVDLVSSPTPPPNPVPKPHDESDDNGGDDPIARLKNHQKVLLRVALPAGKTAISRKYRTLSQLTVVAPNGNQVPAAMDSVGMIKIRPHGGDGTLDVEQSMLSEKVSLGNLPSRSTPKENFASQLDICRQTNYLQDIKFKPLTPAITRRTNARLERAGRVVFSDKPVGLGDSWNVDYPEGWLHTPAATATFTCEGTDTRDGITTVKIRFHYEETDSEEAALTMDGFALIDPVSGLSVVGQANASGIPLVLDFAGNMAFGSGTINQVMVP